MPLTRRLNLKTPSLRRPTLALWLALMSSPAWSASGTPTITTPTAEFVYKYLLGEVAAQRGEFVEQMIFHTVTNPMPFGDGHLRIDLDMNVGEVFQPALAHP